MASVETQPQEQVQPSQQQGYDNSNTGAVYPTANEGELDGPMTYHGKNCRATFKKRESTTGRSIKYILTFKDGATILAQGVAQRSENEDTLKADELHKPPRFRVVMKDVHDEAKTTAYAMWFAHHEERASDYFQIRPDTQFRAADLKEF